MSFKLVKRVIHSDKVDGNHKLVLIILADYVNEAKGNASWPSVTTVGLQAGLSVRHTRRIIRELEQQGVLKTHRQAGLRGTNKYTIDLDGESGADMGVLSGADMGVRPKADIYDTKGGHLRHVGEDMGVRRIDKEHIRTDKVDGAPRSAQGVAVSQQEEISIDPDGVVRAYAHDAPECTEHIYHYQNGCAICYANQEAQQAKEPTA